MSANRFVTYYAIMLPSGELWDYYHGDAEQSRQAAQKYYAMPSYMRDVLGLTEPEPAPKPFPAVFFEQEAAQKACDQLRERAKEVGVDHWGGQVVSAIRTPFTSADPSEQFADQIVAWVAEHGNEQ